MRVVETRVYALLNISVVGQSTLSNGNPFGELLDLRYANPKLAIRTIEQNRDVILGVKIRLSRNIAGENDLRALGLAREAADAVGLPLMVHIGGTYSPLPKILAMLKTGDLVTHSYHGHEGGILDDRDRVLSEVRRAIESGIMLDVLGGHLKSGQLGSLQNRPVADHHPGQYFFYLAGCCSDKSKWIQPRDSRSDLGCSLG